MCIHFIYNKYYYKNVHCHKFSKTIVYKRSSYYKVFIPTTVFNTMNQINKKGINSMKKVSLLTILCFILVFTSCGTLFTQGGSAYREGVSQYESNEYVKSLDSLKSALIKNPEFLEASAMVPVVFNEGTQYYKNIISENESKETPDEADMVYYAYQDIQKLHQIAKVMGTNGLATEDFSTQIEESKIRAAELRFAYAESLEAMGDRSNIKKAVSQYEIVKVRNAQFPDIDKRIEQAVDKAHLTLMIFGSSENSKFQNRINVFLSEALAKNRFVTVVKAQEFQDQSTNKQAAIAWGKENNIDYMLNVNEIKSFEKIIKSEAIRLPNTSQLFKGNKTTLGFTEQYKLDYSLIRLNPSEKVVAQDVFLSDYTSPLFIVSYVSQDDMYTEDMNFEDTGSQTYRILSSDASTETIEAAISSLLSDYSNIYTPSTITDPTDQTQWIKHYESQYSSLDSLVSKEGGAELFYGIDLVYDSNTKLYYFLGGGPLESIQKSKVDSAILNARSRTALNIIDNEKEEFNDYFGFDQAKELGDFLDSIF